MLSRGFRKFSIEDEISQEVSMELTLPVETAEWLDRFREKVHRERRILGMLIAWGFAGAAFEIHRDIEARLKSIRETQGRSAGFTGPRRSRTSGTGDSTDSPQPLPGESGCSPGSAEPPFSPGRLPEWVRQDDLPFDSTLWSALERVAGHLRGHGSSLIDLDGLGTEGAGCESSRNRAAPRGRFTHGPVLA